MLTFLGNFDFSDGVWGLLDYALKLAKKELHELRMASPGLPLAAKQIEGVLEKHWLELSPRMIPKESSENLERAKSMILTELKEYFESSATSLVQEGNAHRTPPKPCSERYYWKLTKDVLNQRLPEPVVESIDYQSEVVLSNLHDPKEEGAWRTMGLVVGQVQSGKTANYTAVISKAADAGYKMIIIFSGIHNDLRRQTQERLDQEFVGFSQWKDESTREFRKERCGVGLLHDWREARAPRCATTLDEDFEGTNINPEKLPWLFVVKKNPAVFRRLLNWLKNNISNKSEWPLLVIDDEADQASINTKDRDNITATNRCIRDVLQFFPRASFVGYTATPFANCFIDADAVDKKHGIDLFPKDFIIMLPKPKNYFGPDEFFGQDEENAMDLFVQIPSEAASNWLPSTGIKRTKKKSIVSAKVPEGVIDAVHQFFLSSAIRYWRERKVRGFDLDAGKPFIETSMLVHASAYVADQKKIAKQILKIAEEVRNAVNHWTCGFGKDPDVFKRLERLLSEQRRITENIENLRGDKDVSISWELPESLDELIECLDHVAKDLSMRLANGEPPKLQPTLLLPEDDGAPRQKTAPVIFIGGNKLSRGLTLPGLCVNVFLRSTVMYDTLLQMGRWFGYRNGYIDLCRICTTAEIIDRFRLINEACLDFQLDVERMNALAKTPKNYKLRIMQHPGLLITAKNKMKTAEKLFLSYSGWTMEHRRLTPDHELIRSNLDAVGKLIEAAQDKGKCTYASREWEGYDPSHIPQEAVKHAWKAGMGEPSGRLWQKVPAADVIEFLETFSPTKAGAFASMQGILDYIRSKQAEGELTQWNVFLPGNPAVNPFGTEYSKRKDATYEGTSDVELEVLKRGGDEYVSVTPKLYEAAMRSIGLDPNAPTKQDAALKRKLFKAVRAETGRAAPEQGTLLLYLLTSDEIKKSKAFAPDAGDPNQEPKPLPTYYLWLPASEKGGAVPVCMTNSTVYEDEDEDFVDPDEDPAAED